MILDGNSGWGTGQDNNNAVLTNSEVTAARVLASCYPDLTVTELARLYGTTRFTMRRALAGITYADAFGPLRQ